RRGERGLGGFVGARGEGGANYVVRIGIARDAGCVSTKPVKCTTNVFVISTRQHRVRLPINPVIEGRPAASIPSGDPIVLGKVVAGSIVTTIHTASRIEASPVYVETGDFTYQAIVYRRPCVCRR